MGVMSTMRTRMKAILWILLILFLGSMTVGGLVGGADILDKIFGWRKVDPLRAVAVVNGENITPEVFFRTVNLRFEEARNQGQEIDERTSDQIYASVWDELVEMTLINQEIKKYEISVTDDEIYYELENNPPQIIQNTPQFLTDDQFDMQKYLAALHNPRGDEWQPLENYVRDYLPRKKIFGLISAGVQMTEQEVWDEYVKRNVQHTISGLLVRASSFVDEDLAPLDEEMRDYYEAHKDEFQQAEARILRYVRWDKKPTAEDSTLVLEEARDLLRRARAGEDFAALADEYSEDPGNRRGDNEGRGGDLGWFGRGQMVKPFEEAAFGTEVGEMIGPVLSPFGYHVIWVRDKRSTGESEEVLASHILLKIEMGPSTRDKLYRMASQFTYDAEDFGFEEAVEMNQLHAEATRPIAEGSLLPGFGYFTSPVRFAFRSEIGDVSEVQESDRAFAVFELDSIVVSGTKPFDDVKSQIQRKLKLEKQMQRAQTLAGDIYQEAANGTTFEQLSRGNEKLKLLKPETQRLSSAIPFIGRTPAVVGALLASEPGALLRPIKIPGGYVVLKLEEREEIDETDWEVQRDALRTELLSKRRNSAISAWLEELKSQAEIVDNRRYHLR